MKPLVSPYARGFSLLELFVALAVLGIVVALALPSYRQYVRRANRSEAATALLRIAAAQERFYVQNGRFAGSGELGAAPPTGLGIGEHPLYVLDIAPDANLALGYVARATVGAESAQRDDTGCWVFSIDERGVRGATTRAGVSDETVAARCWR